LGNSRDDKRAGRADRMLLDLADASSISAFLLSLPIKRSKKKEVPVSLPVKRFAQIKLNSLDWIGLDLRSMARERGQESHAAMRLACPLWVKSAHSRRKKSCPLYPRKRTFVGTI